MSNEITHDHESLSPTVQSVRENIPDGPESNTPNGVNPAISSAIDEGNKETGDQLDGAKDDADKTDKASEDLDDNEKEHKKKGDGIDTELSADSGGGSPNNSMLGGGTPTASAPQSTPTSSQAQQPSMPQMSMPQTSAPSVNPAAMSIPKDALNKLVSNYSAPNKDSSSSDSKGDTPGTSKAVSADAVDVSKVTYDKTGLGPLTDSQLSAVIEEALDKNGISDDPTVRKQWHEVLTFMAEKESSRNPDAVNLTDSNAIGSPAADGHPGQSSRGIWQTIPTTFAAHHVSGTSTNIYDPIACGASAVNYILDNYNVSPSGGASLQAFYSKRMSGGYTGY